MKKIIAVVFCVLLAGSALVQSCKKPDAPSSPILPVVPDTPAVPPVPLTKQQIIQKAIDKLDSGTFYFYSVTRQIESKIGLSPSPPGMYFWGDNRTNKDLELFKYWTGTQGTFIQGQSMIGIRGYAYRGKENFYDRIFVNSAGDSFLGAIFPGNNYTDAFWPNMIPDILPDTLSAGDFQNLLENLNTEVTPFSFPTWVRNSAQIQYYFNKDSLIMSSISGYSLQEKEDSINHQHNYSRFNLLGASKKRW